MSRCEMYIEVVGDFWSSCANGQYESSISMDIMLVMLSHFFMYLFQIYFNNYFIFTKKNGKECALTMASMYDRLWMDIF